MAKVERSFISELISSRDFNTVANENITPMFFKGEDRKLFKFLSSHYSSYGKLPSISIVKKRYPKYRFERTDGDIGTTETMRYWCDEIRRVRKHNEIAGGVSKAIDLLQDQETEEAINKLKSALLVIENTIIKPESMSLQDTSKRRKAYLESKNTGGITGLTTGIDALDALMGGLHNGELITVMGYTGIGKSWFLIIIAIHLTMLGFRVLFVTTEMSKEMLWRRNDAMWNKFDYSRFKKGELTAKEERKFMKYLDDMENSELTLVVEQATSGVSQIGAKIEQHKPDIVLIDGAYLLEDEEGEEDNHAGILRIWNALHRMSIDKDIPMVATTQSKDETKVSLKSLNFAKALATASDAVLALEQDKQMRYDKELLIRPLKLREGELVYNVMLNWDFNKMNFDCIYTEEGEALDLDPRDELEEGIIINV